MISWEYGITATKTRLFDLLPRTVTSLRLGGFDNPRIFADGASWGFPGAFKEAHKLEVTPRYPAVGAFGNFVLSMWELYLRNPNADRYAMFQDDIVCYRNLREYLEKFECPKGYWNLYTENGNVKANLKGWSVSNQMGRGALALVFSNESLRHLLCQPYLVEHRRDSHTGYKGIDKAIIESFKASDGSWREYIHNPSLVQHTGQFSTVKNAGERTSPVFNGEDFDALSLL